MNALVDALSCFDLDRSQLQVLSLGCGETAFKVDTNKGAGGLLQWRGVITAAMKAQSHNAIGQACLLLGKERVMRVDAPESQSPIKMDDYLRAKAELPLMARSLVEGAGREIQRNFLMDEVEPYLPCPPA